MRKVALWCVGLVLSFALAAPVAVQAADSKGAQAADAKKPSLGYLAQWEGKFPHLDLSTMTQWPSGKGFFEDPNVLAMLRTSFAPALVDTITKGWENGTLTPNYDKIQRRGDLLLAFACRPHLCASYSVLLFFNLKTGSVQACWADAGKKPTDATDFWVSHSVRKLPSDACFLNKDFKAYDAFADKSY